MTINERINKKLSHWGLTIEDLTEEELKEAKECLSPNVIDGFFSSEVLMKKSLLKRHDQTNTTNQAG